MEAPVGWYFDDPGAPEFDAPDCDAADFVLPVESSPLAVTAAEAVGFSIAEAANAQHAANRAMAAQLAALAAAVQTSRRNLSVYLWPGALQEPDARELAERAAATDAGMQLQLSTSVARTRAYEGRALIDSLPKLWELFQAGLTSYAHASAAVQHLAGLGDPAALARYDALLAGAAATMTPEAFRQKARTLQERLLAEPAEARHGRAMAERRVKLEPAEDGMAWLHLYLSAPDAIRISQRLSQTARTIHRSETDRATGAGAGPGPAFGVQRRTQMQIRADLAAAWLAGDGTPTAAKVRPILLVPILSLLGLNDNGLNNNGLNNNRLDDQDRGGQSAILHGYGPIDPVTAAKLFHDAPAFRRAGTDPISGELLNLERDKYRPTKAQRDWLTIKYGSCARPGCDCSSAMADIDHVREWARDHGPSNIDNLIPLCTPDHRLKTLSKIRISKTQTPAGDDLVTVQTPTGFTATRLARARPSWWDGDEAPF
ncbi:HNH endonuclease [Microterricola gilva]|uniref:HNH endonuclease n=1 Tax=Microterricola gilva TaxID=393267 RepID=A0A4Q8ALC7_9MICO|nr:HNH endonuclease signature motif containing protein [Microterricola gilva]RZU64695.1 HNH endonuclease [Microterricola gilva]